MHKPIFRRASRAENLAPPGQMSVRAPEYYIYIIHYTLYNKHVYIKYIIYIAASLLYFLCSMFARNSQPTFSFLSNWIHPELIHWKNKTFIFYWVSIMPEGLRVQRSRGPIVSWFNCFRFKWIPGPMVFGINAFRVQRFTSPMVSEPNSFRVQWFPGPMVSKSNDFRVQWFQGPMISGSNGFRVQWFLGPIVSESNGFRVQKFPSPLVSGILWFQGPLVSESTGF